MATRGEDWLYHLPAFLDQVREADAHDLRANLDAEIGGVLYHHRGARVPGYDATFLHRDGRFEVEIDAVGPRSAWAVFDADRSWDFYLSKAGNDQPCLAWMTDAEYRSEEADEFGDKAEAVGMGRFSFGLYLHPPATWEDVEERAHETDAPLFVHRPSGRTLVIEGDREEYAEVLPEELRPDDETAPDHLGVVEAHVDAE